MYRMNNERDNEQLYENRSDWKKELKQIKERLNENGNGLTAAEYFYFDWRE